MWQELGYDISRSSGLVLVEDREREEGRVLEWVEDANNKLRPWNVVFQAPGMFLLQHTTSPGYFYILIRKED